MGGNTPPALENLPGRVGRVFRERAAMRKFIASLWLLVAPVGAQEVTRYLPPGTDARQLPASLAIVNSQGVRDGQEGGPTFTRTPQGMTVRYAVGEADLYGGGEVTGPLRRNGTRIELWNHDNYQYKDHAGQRLYQSHPWALGVRKDGTAVGVLFDSTYRSFLTMGQGAVTLETSAPALPVYVIHGQNPQEVVRELGRLTGTIPLPPRWALGYHQCRYSYAPDSEVKQIASEFRRRKIPCDVLWMDIDYMDGYRIFTFDPKGFPDPGAVNRFLHERDFKSIWMIDPGVKKDPGYSVYESGNDHDVWVKSADGKAYVGKVWPGDCQFPDFTRPDVRGWWSKMVEKFVAVGVDGIWNDMNEPAVFEGVDKSMPEDNRHEGGEELAPGLHRQYHNVYGMLMVRATRAGLLAARPEKRPFVLTRANFVGGQRYAATWTGDNSSTWEDMKMSVPQSLTLGLSGQPFNGPDLGGFALDASPRLWGNWVGAGAFFPFCRAHASKGTVRKEPWSFGPEVEEAARIALSRRYRLMPYLYTLFERSSRTGDPIMQPVFFADPKAARLRQEQQAFMLGPDLLVVPPWATHPQLPAGDWKELSLVAGDQGPYQARLLQRAGSIVPLGEAVQSTSEDSLSSLTLSVAPVAGSAKGEMYWDAGEGLGYQRGDYRRSQFEARLQGGRLVVSEVGHQGERAPDWKRLQVKAI
jgi:alpha-glucosidase